MAIGILSTVTSPKVPKIVFWSAAAIFTCLSCTPEIGAADNCIDCACENECISGGLNQSTCPEGTIYREKVALGHCCPACVRFRNLNEECGGDSSESLVNGVEELPRRITEENGVFVSPDCAPGLYCDYDMTASTLICMPDKGKCDSYQYLDDVLWRPSCEPDGNFSPVQPKGDFLSGRWFCYSPDGKRIFGQAWRKNSPDMTCACSREATAIKAKGERSSVSLHCNEWGNYEHLQCDDGICWCSDTKTGLPQSVAVPALMSALLPCYIKEEFGTQYLRECESSAVAAGRIKDILVKHGTNNTNLGVDLCDPDGSYGSYQIMKDQIHCTWKDKTSLGGYACPIDQLPSVDCNCARDAKLFQLSDVPIYLTCTGNGNYNPKQVSEGKSFCVDSDGYPITDLMDKVDCSVFAYMKSYE